MASFGNLSPMMGNANQILGMPNALQQVGPSSPSFQPGTLPPAPLSAPPAPSMPSIPGAQPVPNAMPQNPQAPIGQQTAQPQGGTVGMPPGNPEAMMIIKTLANRINSITKGEEMARGER